MSNKATTTMQVYFPGGESQKKKVLDEAAARDKSGSALLLQAFEEYLKNHPIGGKK